MNLDTKEQTIKTTLKKYFSATEVSYIMEDWKSNYRDKPIYLLQKMVFHHCAKAGIDMKANTIIKELLVEINKKPKKENIEKPLQVTFHDFYNALYESCPADKQENILESFLASLSDLEKNDLESLTSYLNVRSYFGSDSISTFTVDESQMRNFISKLYQAMCSWMGPVEADGIFHDSITYIQQKGDYEAVNKLI